MESPSASSAWQSLQAHSEQFKQGDFRLSSLFTESPDRFNKFSLCHDDVLLDFSKNYLTEATLELLLELAEQQQLPAAIEAMFSGAIINASEQRAAAHVALREPATTCQFEEVAQTLARMEEFVQRVQSGSWRGFSGKPITDVVNLGVGGSDLGPALAVNALQHYATGHIKMHFVSNIDPMQIDATLSLLIPETTLFIVASKSFTTLETLHNANSALSWLQLNGATESAIPQHFVAVTAEPAAAAAFGIEPSAIFPMWDWVGGRFSLWSAIGLPIALTLGMQQFRTLLAGAHSMDQHFRQAPLSANMPVLLALITVWYQGFFDSHSTAVVPYSHALRNLPAFLQQLSMESLGKSVDREHRPVSIRTGDIVWGAAGTDVQHACMQLLHQGTEFAPVDFIAFAATIPQLDATANQQLLANCFSQSLALMEGSKNIQEPYRSVAGNKPSNTLLLRELSPYSLGSLLALYEHKVYVQSVIWNINAFDQWGVELGKQISRDIFDSLTDAKQQPQLDASTRSLIAQVKQWTR